MEQNVRKHTEWAGEGRGRFCSKDLENIPPANAVRGGCLDIIAFASYCGDLVERVRTVLFTIRDMVPAAREHLGHFMIPVAFR